MSGKIRQIALFACLTGAVGALHAQVFIRGEMTGRDRPVCSKCTLGVTELRFANPRVENMSLAFEMEMKTSEPYWLANLQVPMNFASAVLPAASEWGTECVATAGVGTLGQGQPGGSPKYTQTVGGSNGPGGVTYRGAAVQQAPSAGSHIQITRQWQHMWTMRCRVENTDAVANLAFDTSVYNLITRIAPGGGIDSSIQPRLTGVHHLRYMRVNGKPSVVSFKREGRNRGIFVVFDQPLTQNRLGDGSQLYAAAPGALATPVVAKGALVESITPISPTTYYLKFRSTALNAVSSRELILVHGGGAADAGQDIVGTDTLAVTDGPNALINIQEINPAVGYVSSAMLSSDNVNLTVEFSQSRPANADMPSTYELIAPAGMNIAIGSVTGEGMRYVLNLRGDTAQQTVGNNISVRIAESVINSTSAADGLTTPAQVAHLRWRPVQDPLEAIPLSDTLGPVLEYSLARGELYSLNEVSRDDETGRITYDGLTWTVAINEPMARLRNMTSAGDWTLRSIKRSGAEADVATALTVNCAPTTGNQGTTTCTIGLAGNIAFDSRAVDPVTHYFIRLSGSGANTPQDASGNPVLAQHRQAPARQRARTRFATAAAIFSNATDRFWVVVGFVEVPVLGPAGSVGSIGIVVNSNGGTITGAAVVANSLRIGLPPGVTLPSGSNIIPANTVSFQVDPQGALDGGQSATGAESFTVTLPQNFLSGRDGQRWVLSLNAVDNGAPEIRSFELASQDRTISSGGVLGDIVYRITFTEPLTGSPAGALQSALRLYAVQNEKDDMDMTLAGGLGAPVGDEVVADARVNVTANNNKVYTATFSNVRHAGRNANINSYYAVLNDSAFGNPNIGDGTNSLEDCEGSREMSVMWYINESPVFDRRSNPCSARNAADAPVPGAAIQLTPTTDTRADGPDTSEVFLVARAGIRAPMFAEQMLHFRFALDSTSTIKRATPYDMATGGSIVNFNTLQAGVPVSIHWQFSDTKGFVVGAREKRDVRLVPDVAFVRPLITAAADAAAVGVALTFETVATPRTGAVTVSVDGAGAAEFTNTSQTVMITVPGTQAALAITNSPDVYFPGDPLSELTNDVWGAGSLLVSQVSKRAAGVRKPITITAIKETGGSGVVAIKPDDNALTLEISYEGPSDGVYSADAQSPVANLTGQSFTNPSATAPGVATLMFDITGLSGSPPMLLPIEATLTNIKVVGLPSTSTVAAAIGLSVAVVADDAPAAAAGGRMFAIAGGHPVFPQRGAQLVPGPMVAQGDLGDSGSVTLSLARPQRAPNLAEEDSVALNFELRNVIGDIGGIVISLPSVDRWGVQKLVTTGTARWETVNNDVDGDADGTAEGMVGIYNSNGLGCSYDTGDATSPYRGDDRRLVTNRNGDCLVLYIADGGRYDSDGAVNGVVIDPANACPEPANSMTVGEDCVGRPAAASTPGRRRGGGGAVALGEVLALIALFGLATAALRRRRPGSKVLTDTLFSWKRRCQC